MRNPRLPGTGGEIRDRLQRRASYSGTSLGETSFSLWLPRGRAGIEQVEGAIDAEVHRLIKDGITERAGEARTAMCAR